MGSVTWRASRLYQLYSPISSDLEVLRDPLEIEAVDDDPLELATSIVLKLIFDADPHIAAGLEYDQIEGWRLRSEGFERPAMEVWMDSRSTYQPQ